MTNEDLKFIWQKEENLSATGWDFSYIEDRTEEEKLPWDYKKKIFDFLKKDTRLLDMGTGGGEFLLSLKHNYSLTSVTESWAPNLELCEKKLGRLGITVKYWEDNSPLPFEDNSFDLVINRHESYDINEVKRVLKKGGHFITQQVGSENNGDVSKLICPNYEKEYTCFNLENEVPKFRKAGFKVVSCDQAYNKLKFFDVGAFCWYAKRLPWEFPNFSVEESFERLLSLQNQINDKGFFTANEHRFIIVAKNIK